MKWAPVHLLAHRTYLQLSHRSLSNSMLTGEEENTDERIWG